MDDNHQGVGASVGARVVGDRVNAGETHMHTACLIKSHVRGAMLKMLKVDDENASPTVPLTPLELVVNPEHVSAETVPVATVPVQYPNSPLVPLSSVMTPAAVKLVTRVLARKFVHEVEIVVPVGPMTGADVGKLYKVAMLEIWLVESYDKSIGVAEHAKP